MRLLYWYTEFLDREGGPKAFRGLDKIEFNFSSVHQFQYDGNTLRRVPKKRPLPPQFWANGQEPTNIYNIHAISGANGSGKTTAMNYLVDLLHYLYHGCGTSLNGADRKVRFDPSGNRNLLAFEDDGGIQVQTVGKAAVVVEGFSAFLYHAPDVVSGIQKLKLIFLSNLLSQREYELNVGKQGRMRDSFVYDCTIGATVGQDVSQFFPYETYKQVKFLFDVRHPALSEPESTWQAVIPDLRIPKALRLFPRFQPYESYFEEAEQTIQDLPLTEQLSRLCVGAFSDNLELLTGKDQPPERKPGSLRFLDNIPPAEQMDRLSSLYSTNFVSGSDGCTLQVWNGEGECLLVMKGHTDWVRCVAVTPGGLCVSGSHDCTLRVWDLNTGECLRVMSGHSDPVTCVAVTPDGQCISSSRDNTLRVWDLDTGECVLVMKEHTDWVRCVAVTSSGGLCVSGSRDRTLRVWDLNTGECLRVLKGHTRWINCVAITPDGLCVSGSRDRTLRVWDLNTGECVRVLEGHSDTIFSVAVTPSGLCVSGSDDSTLRVWDLNTGKCLRVLEGHTGTIFSVAVTPSGLCVSSSHDHTRRVWDLNTGECLRELKGPGVVRSVAVLPDRADIKSLQESYRSYLKFLSDNSENLFSHFIRVDPTAYELPLDVVRKDATLYRKIGEFIQKYRDTCKPYFTIDFDWGLSSGEENMLRIFTWLHHIFPTEEGDDYVIRNREGGREEVCDSVLLLLDEADLTLHPEWQRIFLHVLTSALPRLYPASIVKDIQLVLSTHSPLLLGDIPSDNVFYLPDRQERHETFGQNIHTLLKDSFFLNNGTVGEFAARKINALATKLRRTVSQEELDRLRQSVELVAPGVLRGKLELLLRLAEERAEGPGDKVRTLVERASSLTPEERERLIRELTLGSEDT